MNAAEYISEFLYRQGIRHVFEVVGGMTTHLIDAVHRADKIQIVSMHHEQAAAFAADASARVTGRPAVAMATSGPGATNLLTGIGSCYFDSIPAVFITGQVNRNEQKLAHPTRQMGFQETDIVAMAAPITKTAWRIGSPDELHPILEQAFRIAMAGRPGPVLLDIPMDVQKSDLSAHTPERIVPFPEPSCTMDRLSALLDALGKSKRPLVLAGGGIRAAGSHSMFLRFIDKIGLPVVHSLLGTDVLSAEHPCRVGMIGTYGNRWANWAVGNADFLLVLGSRLDIRQTGSNTTEFSQNKTIYHVDCDPAEINNRVRNCSAVVSHLQSFFAEIDEQIPLTPTPDWSSWRATIGEQRLLWPDTEELDECAGINPNRFMHELSFSSGASGAYTVDVGQNQMWAAQSLQLRPGQRFIASGGMGAMGFGLPAAIGATCACGVKPVVAISGDGGFQMNIQELETIRNRNLPIKMIVLDNSSLGMVRQFQKSYFDGRYPGTQWGYSSPDFAAIARSYGLPACTLCEPDQVSEGLSQMWCDPSSPFLLHCQIDRSTGVEPKVMFGQSLFTSSPNRDGRTSRAS